MGRFLRSSNGSKRIDLGGIQLESAGAVCYASAFVSRRDSNLGRVISIAPSILSADFANLAAEISKAEAGGADLLHLDVMDGHFVPNLTIGPPVISCIRKVTGLPLDVHLMVDNPDSLLDQVAQAGADWISVHAEVDDHLHRSLSYIKDLGLQAGVVINPATPIGALEEVLPQVDYVLLMSVNPGFGGQTFISSVLEKIRKLSGIITSNRYRARIEVDGGISADNLHEILAAGAEIIVAGSAIFGSQRGVAEEVRMLKEIASRYINR
jgi:ribulose-phosphate 3-epimerase